MGKYSHIDRTEPFIHDNQLSLYKETNPEAKHYVMWSGGCDSTLLLYELLEQYGPSKVIAVSYEYPWLDQTKKEAEIKHREAIKAKLALRGDRFTRFTHTTLSISQNNHCGFMNTHQDAGLPQALAWLLSVPIYIEAPAYIYDGGIKDDHLTLRLDAYHQMFEGMCEVMRKDITLREPLLQYTKAEVLGKLIRNDLYDVAWYCERPRDGGIPCGRCTPCTTHLTGLSVLSKTALEGYVRESATHYIEEIARITNNKSLMMIRDTYSTDLQPE